WACPAVQCRCGPATCRSSRPPGQTAERGRRTAAQALYTCASSALYAGEGGKTDGSILFANSDPKIVRLFCSWLRYLFNIDEGRLRVRLYLHQGLDLTASTAFWSSVTAVP
ncbi:MAG: hypothetical protein M3387_11220, partial [Actinomycetota bacterium]|nr:hypothetical protein [Actinomycetota bacterium]